MDAQVEIQLVSAGGEGERQHGGVQAVDEKLQEKEASDLCRGMGVVEFLINISDASRSGWSCMDHPKTVADVFEALVGAAFVDSGEDYLTAFHVRLHVTYCFE